MAKEDCSGCSYHLSRNRLKKAVEGKGTRKENGYDKKTTEGGKKMRRLNFRKAAALLAVGVFALSATVSTEVLAQAPGVDPAATKILKRMTDYVGSLKQFSVHTQNTLEDVLDSGHRVDLDVSANVIISRPNKLRAERKGDVISQIFYYDGKTLTLYNPSDKVYATEPAPGTIEGTLDFAREKLGLTVPVADLVYPNSFSLLMQDVTFAKVVGKAVIGGVKCDHVLFSRPGVDFQVWVANTGKPLPYKYVVTDTGIPGRLSITTVMSNWNVAPAVDDARFIFAPPQGVKKISFMPVK
ncbi:MAG: DUF2092 domain-containing protein [Deltaproteobacteria bacterium]|nr:DUF2092 domain-containing protein [Deltaproteobacteria bacterium]